ncbi:energy transducer TonB [Aquiflexum gelatinilyticum]|uniref:Energy transducer TonB n=2 Tax=Aquiflexum gelatinilyticum TaxID=2961943 RepID=A0A9X2T3X0_9BACT|nr:energy transducer TonB [Aquiflexum gelatinilyticum]MCR9016880.1 energy transducer TonB [Aquiflexum gelatinilyticum]MCS4433733.1 energy transducer TonB [Aquiflexum gelatinilyticum]
MKIFHIAAIFIFSFSLIFSSTAQELIYLNKFRKPIYDTKKYEPQFYLIQENGGERTLVEKVFTMEKIMVEENVFSKDSLGNIIRALKKGYSDKGVLEYIEQENIKSVVKVRTEYFESGNIRSLTKTRNKEVFEETYYDESGNQVPPTIFVSPMALKGLEGWNEFLGKNLIYPIDARRAGFEGTVYIHFIVDEEGNIEEAEVINPEEVHELLAREALRVVTKYPYKWNPGTKDGEPVRMSMRVPIRFKLG